MVLAWLLTACGVSPELAATPNEARAARERARPPRLDPAFWKHWGDGRAELSGYRVKFPRYQEIREGRSTLVFVTETFTDAQRVKSDGGHRDEYPVMKLNVVRDFQTGIYDYNVMTSSFHRLDGAGSVGLPVKVSMSMQEWCGHVFEQVIPGDDSVTWTSHSYFDGEADRVRDLGHRAGGMYVDALPAVVRGIMGPVVEPGGAMTVPALSSLEWGRMLHQTPAWGQLTLSADEDSTSVSVPAGTFDVNVVRSQLDDGPTTTWYVEVDWPHRLIRWVSTSGEEAELLGSERLPYWSQHANADEVLLEKLGHPRPSSAW